MIKIQDHPCDDDVDNNNNDGHNYMVTDYDCKKLISSQQLSSSSSSSADYNQLSPKCSGCDQLIVDDYYLVTNNGFWHCSCLSCNFCGIQLESTYFHENGNNYCKFDYQQLFQFHRCSNCNQTIEHNQLVISLITNNQQQQQPQRLLFHLNCFTCSICGYTLTKNDYYGLINGSIYCSQHFNQLIKPNQISSTSADQIIIQSNYDGQSKTDQHSSKTIKYKRNKEMKSINYQQQQQSTNGNI